MYTPKTQKAVSIDEFNEHLNFCNQFRDITYRAAPFMSKEHIQYKAYVEIEDVCVNLTYKNDDGKNITYFTRLDGQLPEERSGQEAFKIMSKYYKIPRAKFPKPFSASGFLYKNDKFENQRYDNCFGYDINSSYSWGLLQDMPDTSVPIKFFDELKDNEIGLDSDYNVVLTGSASMIWPKLKSPFKKFVEHWYNIKKTAPKDSAERQKAKNIMNLAVGYLQRVNPILRTFVLSYANERIKSFVDENTLYSNTDSIVSLVQRPDIEAHLSNEIGDWKLEHQGDFAFKGFCYQWNYNAPSYRGISKAWFKPEYDILKDELPKHGNKYYFNKNTVQIEAINEKNKN